YAADAHPAVLLGGGVEDEGVGVGGAHLVGLFGKYTRQRQAAARLHQGGDLRRQLHQRAGQDVGDHHVGLLGGQILRQVDRELRRVDAVAVGVVAGGFQGLGV